MGPEFAAAAPYIFGLGTAAAMYGSHQQEKKQRGILNRAAEQASETQDKGIAKTIETAEDLTAGNRLKQMQMAEDSAVARAEQDLQGAGADLIDTAQASGGSDTFRRALAQRSATEGARMSKVARELARVRSTDDVGVDNGIKLGRLAEELGSAWNSTRAATRAATLDADSVGMPTIGQLGQIAQLVGGVGMMSGAGAAGTAGSTGAGLSGMDLAADAAIGAGNNVVTAGQAAGGAGAAAGSSWALAPQIWGSTMQRQKKRPAYSGDWWGAR